jgi:hypothetical protein
MQQQQQKYQSQQAGYDRMFDAYRQQTANQFQRERDLNQHQHTIDNIYHLHH